MVFFVSHSFAHGVYHVPPGLFLVLKNASVRSSRTRVIHFIVLGPSISMNSLFFYPPVKQPVYTDQISTSHVKLGNLLTYTMQIPHFLSSKCSSWQTCICIYMQPLTGTTVRHVIVPCLLYRLLTVLLCLHKAGIAAMLRDGSRFMQSQRAIN